jgi:glycogen synthase
MTPSVNGILMTADTVGGVWTYVLELARALGAFAVHVDVAVMGPPPSRSQRRAIDAIDNCDMFERRCKLEWMDEPWKEVEQAGMWLMDLASRLSPDCVHLNGYAHGAFPWRQPVLIVGHSCVFSWHEAVTGAPPSSRGNPYHRAVREGLRRCDAVTAPTNAMLRALGAHYGPFNAAPPIYNGRSSEGGARLDKRPFILSAGRLWDEGKNIGALGRIARRVNWPIYAAGDTRHPDGGNRTVPGVTCLGRLEPRMLARWMMHASIYAHPARYEPFGFTVLEAAQAGCALVLGDIPSLRELWDGAALFAAPDDAEALVEAVSLLTKSGELRGKLAEKARLRALQYSPDRMAGAYYALYGNLLSRAKRRPQPAGEHIA